MSLLSKFMAGRALGDVASLGTTKYLRDQRVGAAKRKMREEQLGMLASGMQQQAPPDPYEQAQKAALDRMRQISEGGETDAEKAQRMALQQQRQQAYAEGRQQLQGQISSGFEANKANMARRGIGGGGAEIAQNQALQQNVGNAMGRLAGEQSANEAEILANQQAQAQQRRMAATQAMADIAQGRQAQDISKLGMAANMFNAQQGRRANRYMAQQGMLGQAAGGLAAGLAFSDKNLKTDIKPGNASEMISEFIEPLDSYSYKYKSESMPGKQYGDKRFTSVMAQDLEKSRIGKNMVINTPEGKMVDYSKAVSPALAAIAELHKRVKRLET